MSLGEPVLFGEATKERLFRLLNESAVHRSVKADGRYTVGTSLGSVRNENQDAATLLRLRFSNQPERDLDVAVVCDGMGGLAGGRDAALTAIVNFAWAVLNSKERIDARALGAMALANAAVYRRFGGHGGTTLSAIITSRESDPVFAHAGDSRIYLLGQRGEIEQVTPDDTLHAALNRAPDQDLESRSKLIQFVGMGQELEPHIGRVSNKGSGFFLATDGIHGVAQSTFLRLVRASGGGADLIRRSLQLADILGGLDNATGVYLPYRIEGEPDQLPGNSLRIQTAWHLVEMYFAEEVRASHAQRVEPPAPDAAPKNARPAKTRQVRKSKASPKAKREPAPELALPGPTEAQEGPDNKQAEGDSARKEPEAAPTGAADHSMPSNHPGKTDSGMPGQGPRTEIVFPLSDDKEENGGQGESKK